MSTHDGYIEWFPWLRIDCFTNQPNPATGKMPLVYFLTHAHSDHLAGLDRASFSGKIYLHPLTKELVLNWIEAPERVRYTELGVTTSESGDAMLRKPAYRFANLTKRPAVARNAVQQRGGRGRVSVADQMVDVAYNQPFQVEGPNGVTVDVTPIDANHCPGSCMYLIEGRVENRLRTVLVTGDIRIDANYLETLRRNPLLAPYVADSPLSASASSSRTPRDLNDDHRGEKGLDEDQRPFKRKKVAAAATTTKRPRVAVKTLDRIYLDTSQVQLDEKLVPKERAVADLVRLIGLYPSETQFFLNAWTPGYEEMLKAVYRAFGERIHLDWYKARQYTCSAMRATDPLLASLGHCDPHPSLVNSAAMTEATTRCADHKPFVGRFHACERRWKCDRVWQGGVGCYEWDEEYLDQIGKGTKKLVRPITSSADASTSSVMAASPTNLVTEGPLIVNVNPAEMPEWCWDEYRPQKEQEIREWVESRRGRTAGRDGLRCGAAGPSRNRDKELSNEEALVPPDSLVVPLARHSSRPELQDFVALFRPRTIYPLTCTNPELFKLLPVIFDEQHLAPGGVERQRAEIARHTAAWFDKAGVRKRLTAMLNSGVFAAAYGFPARGQARYDDDDSDDGDGGGEEADGLKMSTAMANALAKGLNVEGDDRIIEEHLKWLNKATERHGTAVVSPQQQPAGVIVLSDSDDDDDVHDKRRGGDAGLVSANSVRPVPSMRRQSSTSEVARAVQAAPAIPRQLEFASLSSDASRRVSKLGAGLLPPYSNRMPSPFLAAAADDVTPEDILPRNSAGADENRDGGLGSPLRLSDAQKSSRTTTASASDSLGRRSTVTMVDSGGGRRERRQIVPTPELWPPPPAPPSRQTMSAPRLSSSVLSDSTDMLNVEATDIGRGAASSPSRLAQPFAPRPPSSSHASSPPHNARSKGKEKRRGRSTSHLGLEASMSEADAATVAAFYRIQRGKIGPGKIVYFDAGDPRLQGRSSVKAAKAAKAAAKAEQKRQREKENKAATISPKSFRTVSASVSISPRNNIVPGE